MCRQVFLVDAEIRNPKLGAMRQISDIRTIRKLGQNFLVDYYVGNFGDFGRLT